MRLRPTSNNKSKSHAQKGVAIGIVVLSVSLLVALVAAAARMGSGVAKNDSQRIKLESSTLLQQTAQLRNGVALLSSRANLSWTGVGNASGRLTLASASSAYTAAISFPTGPLGIDGTPIRWHMGSYASGTSANPEVYAWTSGNVSLAVCTALNAANQGGEGTPDSVAFGSSLVGAPAQVLSGNPTQAYTISPDLAADMGKVLSAIPASCLDFGGEYRLLVQVNN